MALYDLMRSGYIKHLITDSYDGLHRISDIKKGNITELQGNNKVEYCKKCGKAYLRDFPVKAQYDPVNKITERKCDDLACEEDLYDGTRLSGNQS